MKYKTKADVERVISLNKATTSIEKFIRSYLEGLAVAPIFKAEQRHAELKTQPDVPDVEAVTVDKEITIAEAVYSGPDGNGEYIVESEAVKDIEVVVVSEEYSPNDLRDEAIADLELEYPHLIEPEQTYTEVERLDEHDLIYFESVPDVMPSLIERRPELELSADLARPLYKQMVATKRYDHEVGGVAFDGHVLATDRESVSMLDSYMDKLRRNVFTEVSWKCANGDHFTINAANMVAVEAAVLGHVAAAFAIEEHWGRMIDAAQSVAGFPTSIQVKF